MKEYKGTATPLSGTGKLTGKTISSMQTYYGKAIRSNSNEFYVLANELWHCTEVDDSDYWHRYCPEDNCCPYKQSANNIDQNVFHINLSECSHDIIKPILSDDNLLPQCLRGSTQNYNEA